MKRSHARKILVHDACARFELGFSPNQVFRPGISNRPQEYTQEIFYYSLFWFTFNNETVIFSDEGNERLWSCCLAILRAFETFKWKKISMMEKTFQKRIESPNGFVPGSKYHSVDIAHLLIDGYITSRQRVVKRSVILLDASARMLL